MMTYDEYLQKTARHLMLPNFELRMIYTMLCKEIAAFFRER